MRSIILAAGRGSRMGGVTAEHPKCLTSVYGKQLINHQISALTDAVIREIAIVTGYKSEMLKNYGTHHFYNPEWAETNMVASLFCAKDWLDIADCIVSYSDIFYGSQIVKELIASKADIAIAYDPNWLELWSKRFKNPLDDAETFRIDKDGYVTDIGQKASSIEDPQGQYMGLLKFSRGFFNKCLDLMPDVNLNKIDMTSLLNLLIDKNVKIKAIRNLGPWGECDTKHDLRVYE